MLRGRAGALALVPPVEPVGVAPLIDVEDALPLVRKALRSRVHLKAWHSRLCEPSEACRSEVHSFFSANGNALLPFNLGLKQITTRLPLLLKCAASEPVALVDVGAGIHGLAPWYKLHATSLTPDDSDALWLLGGFGRRAEVHAFESSRPSAAELRTAAASRTFSRNYTEQLHVHTQGVGSARSLSRVKRCDSPNLWTVEGVGRKEETCRLGAALNVTTLDAFAEALPLPLLYVKVDVEGGELEIVKGMGRLLGARRVPIMSFEYAFGWNRLFQLRRPLTVEERRNASATSLRRFSSQMSRFGYLTYLVASGKRASWPHGVVLLPVYGQFWHDDYEVCFDRSRVYGTFGQWCWNDVLVVDGADECVRAALFRDILPATKGQGKRGVVWRDPPPPSHTASDESAPSAVFKSCDCL